VVDWEVVRALSFLYLAVRKVFALFRPKGLLNSVPPAHRRIARDGPEFGTPHGRMLELIAEARAGGTMPTKEEALELVGRPSEALRRDG
jgi:hypothetical protein